MYNYKEHSDKQLCVQIFSLLLDDLLKEELVN